MIARVPGCGRWESRCFLSTPLKKLLLGFEILLAYDSFGIATLNEERQTELIVDYQAAPQKGGRLSSHVLIAYWLS